VHEDASGPRVLFVINPHRKAVTAEVDVPAAMAFEDLMSGERFSGTEQVAVPMDGWSCRMLSLRGAAGEDRGRGDAVGAAS
jgi:hypothetical protein